MILTLCLSAGPALGQPTRQSGSPFAEDEIVVKLKSGAGARVIGSALAAANAVAVPSPALAKIGARLLKVPRGRVLDAIASLQQTSQFDYVEPNYRVEATDALTPTIPNDPFYPGLQWGPPDIQAPLAWSVTTGTASVIIAVIDTGVDLTHPDLAQNIWTNPGEMGLGASGNDKRTNGIDDDGDGYVDDWHGWNFFAGTNNPQDDHGHGTHVSGIAAAVGNNGVGIAGMAWGVRIMALKILDSAGSGSDSDLATAMIYATDHGARVINLSVGDQFPASVMEDAVNYAYAHGVTVVAAAGNDAHLGVRYPAAYPNAIAVASVDSSNGHSAFSNSGPEIAVSAPGSNIYSTCRGGGYCYLTGTSMATPHVAGAAALLASLPAFDTPAKIRAALQDTAQDLGVPGWDQYYGYGLVQTYAALNDFYRPALAPTSAAKLSAWEAGVTYILTITNRGVLTDSFAVGVSPGSVFTNGVEPPVVSGLAFGGSAPITLTVAFPPDVAKGTHEAATVTITSLGDPAQQATAAISTTAAYTRTLILILR